MRDLFFDALHRGIAQASAHTESQSRAPAAKGVDLQCLIRQLEGACMAEGAQRARDRHHQDYGDDLAEPLRREVDAEVERLQHAEFELIDKTRALIEAAERGFVGAELRLAIAGMRAAIRATGSGL